MNIGLMILVGAIAVWCAFVAFGCGFLYGKWQGWQNLAMAITHTLGALFCGWWILDCIC